MNNSNDRSKYNDNGKEQRQKTKYRDLSTAAAKCAAFDRDDVCHGVEGEQITGLVWTKRRRGTAASRAGSFCRCLRDGLTSCRVQRLRCCLSPDWPPIASLRWDQGRCGAASCRRRRFFRSEPACRLPVRS